MVSGVGLRNTHTPIGIGRISIPFTSSRGRERLLTYTGPEGRVCEESFELILCVCFANILQSVWKTNKHTCRQEHHEEVQALRFTGISDHTFNARRKDILHQTPEGIIGTGSTGVFTLHTGNKERGPNRARRIQLLTISRSR